MDLGWEERVGWEGAVIKSIKVCSKDSLGVHLLYTFGA